MAEWSNSLTFGVVGRTFITDDIDTTTTSSRWWVGWMMGCGAIKRLIFPLRHRPAAGDSLESRGRLTRCYPTQASEGWPANSFRGAYLPGQILLGAALFCFAPREEEQNEKSFSVAGGLVLARRPSIVSEAGFFVASCVREHTTYIYTYIHTYIRAANSLSLQQQ